MDEEILKILLPLRNDIVSLKELAMAVYAEEEYREEIGEFVKNYQQQGLEPILQMINLNQDADSFLQQKGYEEVKTLIRDMEELKMWMEKIIQKFHIH